MFREIRDAAHSFIHSAGAHPEKKSPPWRWAPLIPILMEQIESLYDKRYNIRIEIYHPREVYIVDDVVYFRYKMPYGLVMRYRWYFEYLAALLKVKYPRRKVRLIIGECKLALGNDYVREHRDAKLKGRYKALKKAMEAVPELDLFGFAEVEKANKMQRIKSEIERLESGFWDYEYFAVYINKTKEYLSRGTESAS